MDAIKRNLVLRFNTWDSPWIYSFCWSFRQWLMVTEHLCLLLMLQQLFLARQFALTPHIMITFFFQVLSLASPLNHISVLMTMENSCTVAWANCGLKCKQAPQSLHHVSALPKCPVPSRSKAFSVNETQKKRRRESDAKTNIQTKTAIRAERNKGRKGKRKERDRDKSIGLDERLSRQRSNRWFWDTEQGSSLLAF